MVRRLNIKYKCIIIIEFSIRYSIVRMKLTLNQSFQKAIGIINKAIQLYDFEQKLLGLDKYYLFHFEVVKNLPKNCRQEILSFTQQFFKLLLLNMFGERKQPQWRIQTIQSNHKTKHTYCKLMEKLTTLKLITKAQIILFLITLITRKFLQQFIDNNWRQSTDFQEEPINQFEVEEYVFIVMTFQTVGNLVSPKTFSYLKNKHIKKIYFRSNANTMGIIKSLRNIKKKLTSYGNKPEVKNKDKQVLSNGYIKFIRDNLKTNFKVREQPIFSKDPLMSSMDQTFYHHQTARKPQTKGYKIVKKIPLRQLSRAALTNYKLSLTPGHKNYHKSPPKNQPIELPKKITKKFQIIPQEEEKKEQRYGKKNWNQLLHQLKNDSEKHIAKIDRTPFDRSQKNGRNYQSEMHTTHEYDEKLKQRLMWIQSSHYFLDKSKSKRKCILPSPVKDQQQFNNIFYKLKSDEDRNIDQKYLFSHPFEWKYSQTLKKKEQQFNRRCKERKEKIKDSFMNIPFKVY